jgi:membrane protease YdiL (CAAX protease family)
MNSAVTTDVTPTRPRQRLSSLCWFFALAGVALLSMQLSYGLFPGDRGVAVAGRLLCSIIAVSILIAGSRQLLQRDHVAPDRLGLALTAAHGKAFVFGIVFAGAIILALLGVFYLVTPFELLPGSVPLTAIPVAALNYFAGNFAEELVFRGYLLITLARWLGTTRALWLLAVPFGLSHFLGLDALALLKMTLTAGAMHFVFAYAYLATRSLWAAVSLHAVSNILLHSVVGLGEPATFSVRFLRDLPTSVDVHFLVFFGTAAAIALLLSRLPQAKLGAAWLETPNTRGRSLVALTAVT